MRVREGGVSVCVPAARCGGAGALCSALASTAASVRATAAASHSDRRAFRRVWALLRVAALEAAETPVRRERPDSMLSPSQDASSADMPLTPEAK